MTSKRSHSAANAKPELEEPVDPSDELAFTALGGGSEVGRSCHILEYKGKTVMLDAGIHPAHEGLASLPFYDDFDLGTVDILLITHFHMDHAASLPYVLAKTNFSGKVYMTHPTKAIYKHLMQDSVRVQNTHTSKNSSGGTDGYVNQLFNEQDVLSTLPLIQTISFNTTHTHNGIRFTPFPAGHVLGACMYLIEIAGLNILFTGDYSREDDRHLTPATLPPNTRVDCLITESTFGVASHIPRAERERNLMGSITKILNRGGRALLPVFAIGRAQELLLILEDYWERNPEYRKYPIYYASALARKCMVVYQTYIDAMNSNIRGKFNNRIASTTVNAEGGQGNGPWDFQFIRALKNLERFDDTGGCIMLAAPGMLQNGVSRALLERWAPDARNGVVITGYSVEGTMAKQVITQPDSIPSVMQNRQQGPAMGKRPGGDDKVMIPRRCSVEEFSFAAHVDGDENINFIEQVNAPVIILVHGEKHQMARLRSKLLRSKKYKVFSPVNCEELRIPFQQDKMVRVVGRLASAIQPPSLLPPSPPASDEGELVEGVKRLKTEPQVQGTGQVISGVLVQNDFKLSLMAPEDLKEYAGLATTTILCRQRLTLGAAGPDLIRWALESTFGAVEVEDPANIKPEPTDTTTTNGQTPTPDPATTTVFTIMSNAVRLTHHSNNGELELEWEGNATNDSIADAVMAVLLSVETSPAAIKQSSSTHSHSASPLPATRNPLLRPPPEEKLERLFMFLEAQFGEDSITPIATPKPASSASEGAEAAEPVFDEVAVAKELARLHAKGIPVPGLRIEVQGQPEARLWLEGLDVECKSKNLAQRIKAVVERGLSVVG
ncbi:hypothetical protein MBLNU230_g7377t1 [Neophaeotheca triangularis]